MKRQITFQEAVEFQGEGILTIKYKEGENNSTLVSNEWDRYYSYDAHKIPFFFVKIENMEYDCIGFNESQIDEIYLEECDGIK